MFDRASEPMRICLIEPYNTGSHRNWVAGYANSSKHHVVPLTLKGQFWKWRMHGGAVTLARHYRNAEVDTDLFLVTDLLDATTFLALTRDLTASVPLALYMHENQLTYPMRPDEKRDLHYAFINYASMLCADRVFFNSQFHLDSWFEELPRLLKHFPDHNELHSVNEIRARSSVLPLGLDLARLDAHRTAAVHPDRCVILWNHRWEYDKNHNAFLSALYRLLELGLDFQLVLLGESFVRVPEELEEARERLGDRILHCGYVESVAEYATWLWRADIVVSTSIQEFFGASVVEAIYCDCLPILPRRLSYPQFIPQELQEYCLYDDDRELVDRLAAVINSLPRTRRISVRQAVAGYDWAHMSAVYDHQLSMVLEARHKA